MMNRCSYCANVDPGERGLHDCDNQYSSYQLEQREKERQELWNQHHVRIRVTYELDVPVSNYDSAYKWVAEVGHIQGQKIELVAVEGIRKYV